MFKIQNIEIIKLECFVICSPRYKPTNTYIDNSAGADNSLIEIYLDIKNCVSSEVLKKCSIAKSIGCFKNKIINPINKAMPKFLIVV